ncbi:MAG: hypothetical protein NTY38_04115 [Acidobacteria bacterium]|nr:hypothetical protein [Acidobacteriota bacterium]
MDCHRIVTGLRAPVRSVTLALVFATGLGAQFRGAEKPIHLGHLTLVPQAYFNAIGEWRSAATSDSVSTAFGQIPLNETYSQWIGSTRHSRLMLDAKLKFGALEFTTYLENDFMDFRPGQHAFRWRQYWERVRFGRWEVTGGAFWSLLRPNRHDIEPERELMNTVTVEPNYHVGLAGARRRQLRLGYQGDRWKAAVAWEGAYGLWVGKVARDRDRLHLEAAGFTGRAGQRGVMISEVFKLTPRLRITGQQFASRRALAEALSLVPRGVSGVSTVAGAEFSVTRRVELFSYGGVLYAERSNGNRLVRQYTMGVNHLVPSPVHFGSMVLSIQYSETDRALWQPRHGSMSYVQTRLRYIFN